MSELLDNLTEEAPQLAIEVGNGLITTRVIGRDATYSMTRDQVRALIKVYERALGDPRLDVHT